MDTKKTNFILVCKYNLINKVNNSIKSYSLYRKKEDFS